MNKHRLLNIGEIPQSGDEYWDNDRRKWEADFSRDAVEEDDPPCRRPLTPLQVRAEECFEFLEVIRGIAWKNSEDLSDNDKLWCNDAWEFIEEIKNIKEID